MPISGTIGVASSSEVARFTPFWHSLAELKRPGECALIHVTTYDVAKGRNEIIRHAHGDWVWLLDDDHIFHPNLLLDLLDRNVDIVQPIALKRDPPFLPIAMDRKAPGKPNVFRNFALTKAHQGLRPMQVLGGGCLLIRRKVWETIPEPWFRPGAMNPGFMAEDVFFTQQAIASGFTPYLDCDHPIGHMTAVGIWPYRDEQGRWQTQLHFGTSVIPLEAAEADMEQGAFVLHLPTRQR